MKKKLVISTGELPLRPKQLNNEDIAEVFGGCTRMNMACSKSTDCCDYGKYGTGAMGNPCCVSYEGPPMHNAPSKVCL